MTHLLESYFSVLQKNDLSDLNEHSLRTGLENLLNGILVENSDLAGITILQEPKRAGRFGTPDFKISDIKGSLGYCETKKVGENLAEIIKSPQIQKYLELTDNLLLTDYCTFIWLKEKAEVRRVVFCKAEVIGNKKAPFEAEKAAELRTLLLAFLRETPKGIATAKELAKALASRTKTLKDFLYIELANSHAAENVPKLLGLYQTFQQTVSSDLTHSEFADAYAQMLSYGLFLAKLNADTKTVELDTAKKYIPNAFELIKELTGFLEDLQEDSYQPIRWVINEILTILNHLDLRGIQENLSFNKTTNKGDSENKIADPYLYFYEDFLGQYDPNLRKAKGVYYTPPAVVNFIVRAIDEVLKNTFNLLKGLGDTEKVTILDFATGTGTFLLEITRLILAEIPPHSTRFSLTIKNHILKNIYGFEYLIAPYTIAHLKLSQFLHENGYDLQGKERLQIFLTNTLEPLNTQGNFMLPSLSKEGVAAQQVKKQPILVITGNPPYSGHSKNKGKWIIDRVNEYKKVGNEVLKEKNPKWLQDDYVKFIRFAEWKMQQVTEGMVAVITNHSFLDNPTFRLMRKSLMTTFNQLHIIDLHGNSKKKETTPLELGQEKDKNVFDIQQGVSISVFIKKEGLERKIFHTDFYGTRKTKYDMCLNNSLNTLNWTELTPQSPYYLFIPQDKTHKISYEKGWNLKNIFQLNNIGILTHRDDFLVDFSDKILKKRIEKFVSAEDVRRIKEWFSLKDTRDWEIKTAWEAMQGKEIEIKSYHYRPFDHRFICYDADLVERRRYELMQHFEKGKNVALIVGRAGQNVAEGMWNLCFISDKMSDANLFYRGGATVFPLYYYNGGSKNGENFLLFADENGKKSNFTPAFKEFIVKKYPTLQTEAKASDIFDYIYGFLHSPTYRSKYADFLKMDFPHIIFAEELSTFQAVAKLGKELAEAHLLQTIPDLKIGEPMEIYTNEVTEISYKNQRLYYNEKQYFDEISEEIWAFQIGGYRVLEKFLKDRKGQNISQELLHIQKIINVLDVTLQKMTEIDEITKNWI